MIILLSPAKTFAKECSCSGTMTKPIFEEMADRQRKWLKNLTLSELETFYAISKKQAETVFHYLHDPQSKKPALFAYAGEAYKKLNPSDFDQEDLVYAQQHLRILSAMYGILKPLDGIAPYRLDMSHQFMETTPLKMYAEEVSAMLKDLGPILDLSSQEFGVLAQTEKIRVFFYNKDKGVLRSASMNSKAARGMLTRFLIKNKITDMEQVKSFCEAGYSYASELSEPKKIVFVKDTSQLV